MRSRTTAKPKPPAPAPQTIIKASPLPAEGYRLACLVDCRYPRDPGARPCKLCKEPIEVGQWYYVIAFPSRAVRVAHKECVEQYEIEIGKTQEDYQAD